VDLEAIKERAAKATPGPWTHPGAWDGQAPNRRLRVLLSQGPGILATVGTRPNGEPMREGREQRLQAAHATAKFIAHAREDIPALVAEVERLRGLLEHQTHGDQPDARRSGR
jgi:hypothetical protein